MPDRNMYIGTQTLIDGGGSGTISVWGSNSESTFEINTKSGDVEMKIKKDPYHEPEVYFRLLHKKFSVLQRRVIDKRLKLLEQAFNKAIQTGQEYLAEKFMNEYLVKIREAQIAAVGIKYSVEREVAMKFSRSVKEGHIQDTLLNHYTRLIPKKVLKKLEKVKSVFDAFLILHYWSNKSPDAKDMSDKERVRMADPILFGMIRENNRLYFIDDWTDEYCTLTFDELTKIVARIKV